MGRRCRRGSRFGGGYFLPGGLAAQFPGRMVRLPGRSRGLFRQRNLARGLPGGGYRHDLPRRTCDVRLKPRHPARAIRKEDVFRCGSSLGRNLVHHGTSIRSRSGSLRGTRSRMLALSCRGARWRRSRPRRARGAGSRRLGSRRCRDVECISERNVSEKTSGEDKNM